MLVIIGTMIGGYILVQCIAIATRPGLTESAYARAAAALCGIGVFLLVLLLWQSGAQFEQSLRQQESPCAISVCF